MSSWMDDQIEAASVNKTKVCFIRSVRLYELRTVSSLSRNSKDGACRHPAIVCTAAQSHLPSVRAHPNWPCASQGCEMALGFEGRRGGTRVRRNVNVRMRPFYLSAVSLLTVIFSILSGGECADSHLGKHQREADECGSYQTGEEHSWKVFRADGV